MTLIPVLEAQQVESQKLARNGAYTEFYVARPDFSDGFLSISYERVLGKKKRLNCRIGIWPDFESTISIPLTVNWVTGPYKPHHFEYGVGAVFPIEHYVDPYDPAPVKTWFYDMPAIMVPLMYRYQKANGFYLRGGINLFLSWPSLACTMIGALAPHIRRKDGKQVYMSNLFLLLIVAFVPYGRFGLVPF